MSAGGCLAATAYPTIGGEGGNAAGADDLLGSGRRVRGAGRCGEKATRWTFPWLPAVISDGAQRASFLMRRLDEVRP